MKEAFKKIITDFQEQQIQLTVPRDIRIPIDSGKIVTLIGVRRSGKTSILYHLIEKLRQNVNPANIIYINLHR